MKDLQATPANKAKGLRGGEELQHALTISRQIDYLGKMPSVTPKPVKVSEKARDMLKFDLDNEAETIRAYRERVRQCEALNEFAMAEQIREILVQEQDHLIDLATALGEDPPDLGESRWSKDAEALTSETSPGRIALSRSPQRSLGGMTLCKRLGSPIRNTAS